jgi:hypothetical protein
MVRCLHRTGGYVYKTEQFSWKLNSLHSYLIRGRGSAVIYCTYALTGKRYADHEGRVLFDHV